MLQRKVSKIDKLRPQYESLLYAINPTAPEWCTWWEQVGNPAAVPRLKVKCTQAPSASIATACLPTGGLWPVLTVNHTVTDSATSTSPKSLFPPLCQFFLPISPPFPPLFLSLSPCEYESSWRLREKMGKKIVYFGCILHVLMYSFKRIDMVAREKD